MIKANTERVHKFPCSSCGVNLLKQSDDFCVFLSARSEVAHLSQWSREHRKVSALFPTELRCSCGVEVKSGSRKPRSQTPDLLISLRSSHLAPVDPGSAPERCDMGLDTYPTLKIPKPGKGDSSWVTGSRNQNCVQTFKIASEGQTSRAHICFEGSGTIAPKVPLDPLALSPRSVDYQFSGQTEMT